MRAPDPRSRHREHPAKPGASGQRAPREAVAAIIGAEAGIGIGLLVVGGTFGAPLALGALGAGIGAGAVHMRNTLLRRWLRAQLRGVR
jgi:hypothetical protein